MKPCYETVGDVLDVQEVPEKQWSPRVLLLKEAATKVGHADRFRRAPVAVSCDKNLEYDFNSSRQY